MGCGGLYAVRMFGQQTRTGLHEVFESNEVGQDACGFAFAEIRKYLRQFSKIRVNDLNAFAKTAQPLRGRSESLSVAINSDYASTVRGFKDRFGMSAEPERAVDEEVSSLRREETNCFA